MGPVITGLALWTAFFGGAFMWDYRHQRLPDTPLKERSLRRWRMVGWAACGLAAIWWTLAAAGLTRQEPPQATPPPWWIDRPWSAPPPPEATILHAALIGGSLILIVSTILLHRHLQSRASGPPQRGTSGSVPGKRKE